MTRPARPPIARLGEFLNKTPHLREQQALFHHYRWIASVSRDPVNSIDWFLLDRELLGLDDDLTDAQVNWLDRLKVLVRTCLADRELRCQRRVDNSISYERRRELILQRKAEDDRRRLAIYDHVPKAQRKLTVHERMAAAWKRLNSA